MSVRRIAVTGGPGAGKTTLWSEVARSHDARVIAVPEVATLLFAHVFPPVQSEHERRAVQRSIFAVQKNLEAIHEARLGPGQVLLCDRGTPDGGGYWPEGHEHFFGAMATHWEAELERYDAVIFLETAAAGGLAIASNNQTRREDHAEAVAVDRRLQQVWSKHPRFVHIPHEREFATKLARGLSALQRFL